MLESGQEECGQLSGVWTGVLAGGRSAGKRRGVKQRGKSVDRGTEVWKGG